MNNSFEVANQKALEVESEIFELSKSNLEQLIDLRENNPFEHKKIIESTLKLIEIESANSKTNIDLMTREELREVQQEVSYKTAYFEVLESKTTHNREIPENYYKLSNNHKISYVQEYFEIANYQDSLPSSFKNLSQAAKSQAKKIYHEYTKTNDLEKLKGNAKRLREQLYREN